MSASDDPCAQPLGNSFVPWVTNALIFLAVARQ
jgi:hypothetical protein